jgi:hypothetical protein
MRIPLEIALHVDSFITGDLDSLNWLEACGLSREQVFEHWSRKEEAWTSANPRAAWHFHRVFGNELQIYELDNAYSLMIDRRAITCLPLDISAQHMLNLGQMLSTRLSTYDSMFDGLAFSQRNYPAEMQQKARENMLEIAKNLRFCIERMNEITSGLQWMNVED